MKGCRLHWTPSRRRCALLLIVAYAIYLLHRVWSLYQAASALSTHPQTLPLRPVVPSPLLKQEQQEAEDPYNNVSESTEDGATIADDDLSDDPPTDTLFSFAEESFVELAQEALSAEGYKRLAIRRSSSDAPLPQALLQEGVYRKVENVLTRRGREIREHGSRRRSMVAVIIGQSGIIARDGATYKKAFGSFGFRVDTAAELNPSVASGRIEGNLRSVRRLDWDVALCLSLKTAKCMSKIEFARMEANSFKRLNRIAGLKTVLWSKDGFCRSLKESVSNWLGIFTFPCWTLPKEFAALKAYAATPAAAKAFIVKPYSQGGGKGIFVVDAKDIASTSVLRSARFVVQPYLERPHLLEGRKWDLRTYVVVTSLFPLRAYIHSRGLVRLSTTAYDPRAKSGGNKSQYLTNTSINRKYASMNDITWSFEKLKQRLGAKTFALLFQRIQTAVAFTLLASLHAFSTHYSGYSPWSADSENDFRCANCYQLLGVDLIADEKLHPRVIEVNGEPSMKLTGDEEGHYDQTKLTMQRDLVKLVFGKPKENLVESLRVDMRKLGLSKKASEYSDLLNKDKSMVQYLLEFKKESSNMGEFRRIFPPPTACACERHRALWDAMLKEEAIVRGLGGAATVEVLTGLECLRVQRCIKEGRNCSSDLSELEQELLFDSVL